MRPTPALAAAFLLIGLGGCYSPRQFHGPGVAIAPDHDPYDWMIVFQAIDLGSAEPVELSFTGPPPDRFTPMFGVPIDSLCTVIESDAAVKATLLDSRGTTLAAGTCRFAHTQKWVNRRPIDGAIFGASVARQEYQSADLDPGRSDTLRIEVLTPAPVPVEVRPVLVSTARWVWP